MATAEPDLPQQVLQQLSSLSRQVEALSQPVQPKIVRLGGFLAGAALTLLIVGFVYWRFKFSLQRVSQRERQRLAVIQLSKLDGDELRNVLGRIEVIHALADRPACLYLLNALSSRFATGEINLPSWIQYPDFQRVQWVNTVMQQLWPYAARYTANWADENIPQLLEQNKPAWMRSIKLHRFRWSRMARLQMSAIMCCSLVCSLVSRLKPRPFECSPVSRRLVFGRAA
jgi:hypothetical protein